MLLCELLYCILCPMCDVCVFVIGLKAYVVV